MTADGCFVPQGWSYTLEASFLEIYNETIRDLLNTSKEKLTYDIRIKENNTNSKVKEVYVSNLKVYWRQGTTAVDAP